jgi:hypothetical protein
METFVKEGQQHGEPQKQIATVTGGGSGIGKFIRRFSPRPKPTFAFRISNLTGAQAVAKEIQHQG